MNRFCFIIAIAFILSISGISHPAGFAGEPQQQEMGQESYFKKWLEEDVAYIITGEEEEVFKNLTTDEEREKFIEQFWFRRDPDPRTANNEFKEEHYRRLAYVAERYTLGEPGWLSDRGRIYIMFGEPAEIVKHRGGLYQREIYEGGGFTSVYPFELWRYRYIDGVGSDVEIEFVDPTMTGEYRIAMSADEKDAFLNAAGGLGLNLFEMAGMSTREDRPYLNPDMARNYPFMREQDMPFQRLERHFALQRAPEIKFKDLKSYVTARVTYDQLPFSMRTDFIWLSPDKILVPITVEVSNGDLEYKSELGFSRAQVNMYGLVTSLSGRILSEFEQSISSEYTDALFEQGKSARSLAQHIVALPPGQRVKLDLMLEDTNSGKLGSISRGIVVPKFAEDKLQSSSIILASSATAVAEGSDYLEQFVLGNLKIHPNVNSQYKAGDILIPYLQIYNVEIDQATLEPSIQLSYTFKSGGEVVGELQDTNGSSVQFFSGERIVLLGGIPLKSFNPGKYELEIGVLDKLSNRSLVARTNFTVN